MRKFQNNIKSVFTFLCILMIGASCCNSNPNKNEQQNAVIAQADSTAVNFVDLLPVDTIDNKFVYQTNGFQFITSFKLGFQTLHGADFTVTSFKINDENEFAIYFGYFPSYPQPIKYEMSEWSDHTIQNELSKNSYFKKVVEVYIENGINWDSSTSYKTDSMYLEVYRLNTKDIWIRKPLKKRKGPIDIAIDFHADSIYTMLHVMGYSKSTEESKYFIDLAKTFKKL
jgi:hypothetical protein